MDATTISRQECERLKKLDENSPAAHVKRSLDDLHAGNVHEV